MHNDNNYTSSSMLLLFAITVLLFGNLFAAPSLLKDEDSDDFVEFYDQRQNGTENIRIDMNGMIIVVSPLEALLAAASLLNPIFPTDFEDEFNFKKTSQGSDNKHPIPAITGTGKPNHNNKRESIQTSTTEKNNNNINNKKKG